MGLPLQASSEEDHHYDMHQNVRFAAVWNDGQSVGGGVLVFSLV